ncbi:MAG: hypothetical protein EOO16_11860 [Chitinophagaceae bacterium]|nr:MAG: hypothetical protein EOO16_11860 [Chitinophagaceae bacterium]
MNTVTTAPAQPKNDRVQSPERFGALLLEGILLLVVTISFWIPLLETFGTESLETAHEPTRISFGTGSARLLAILGLALAFCKDGIGGRSLAKRIVGMQVLMQKTGKAAGPLRCLVRNAFLLLGPVELLVALGEPERRIGDRVAGTMLVKRKPAERPSFQLLPFLAALSIAYALVAVGAAAVPVLYEEKPLYAPGSYNPAASARLAAMLRERIPEAGGLSVRVYDSSMGRPVRWVSVAVRLNDNLLEDNGRNRGHDFGSRLENNLESWVDSVYPDRSYCGTLFLVYSEPGTYRSRRSGFGLSSFSFGQQTN